MPDEPKARVPAKRPRGRQSIYTPELAEGICKLLADGKTLNQICKADGMPAESAVREWALSDRDGFGAKYTRARELGYLRMADDLVTIAADESTDVQRSRLMVDTHKWLLSKALPKLFGDKLQIGGDGGEPIKVEVGEAIAKLTEAVESVATRMKDGDE
jgi:hypothetical protein